MANILEDVQAYVVGKLSADYQLSGMCTFLVENSKDIDFQIKNALGRQGIVAVCMTPKATYAGKFEDLFLAWNLEQLEIDIVENPIINRGKKTAYLTSQDIAMRVFDVLCPLSGDYEGQFCPVTVEEGEDNGMLVNKCILKALVYGEHGDVPQPEKPLTYQFVKLLDQPPPLSVQPRDGWMWNDDGTVYFYSDHVAHPLGDVSWSQMTSYVGSQISSKADLSSLESLSNSLSDYYTKSETSSSSELDVKFATKTDLSSLESLSSSLSNFYEKSETSSSSELDGKFSTKADLSAINWSWIENENGARIDANLSCIIYDDHFAWHLEDNSESKSVDMVWNDSDQIWEAEFVDDIRYTLKWIDNSWRFNVYHWDPESEQWTLPIQYIDVDNPGNATSLEFDTNNYQLARSLYKNDKLATEGWTSGHLSNFYDKSETSSSTQLDQVLSTKAEISSIPTLVSQLSNDSGYITSADISALHDGYIEDPSGNTISANRATRSITSDSGLIFTCNELLDDVDFVYGDGTWHNANGTIAIRANQSSGYDEDWYIQINGAVVDNIIIVADGYFNSGELIDWSSGNYLKIRNCIYTRTSGTVKHLSINHLATEEYIDSQVSSKADLSAIPTKVSQLSNDSGYITSTDHIVDADENSISANLNFHSKTDSFNWYVDGVKGSPDDSFWHASYTPSDTQFNGWEMYITEGSSMPYGYDFTVYISRYEDGRWISDSTLMQGILPVGQTEITADGHTAKLVYKYEDGKLATQPWVESQLSNKADISSLNVLSSSLSNYFYVKSETSSSTEISAALNNKRDALDYNVYVDPLANPSATVFNFTVAYSSSPEAPFLQAQMTKSFGDDIKWTWQLDDVSYTLDYYPNSQAYTFAYYNVQDGGGNLHSNSMDIPLTSPKWTTSFEDEYFYFTVTSQNTVLATQKWATDNSLSIAQNEVQNVSSIIQTQIDNIIANPYSCGWQIVFTDLSNDPSLSAMFIGSLTTYNHKKKMPMFNGTVEETNVPSISAFTDSLFMSMIAFMELSDIVDWHTITNLTRPSLYYDDAWGYKNNWSPTPDNWTFKNATFHINNS